MTAHATRRPEDGPGDTTHAAPGATATNAPLTAAPVDDRPADTVEDQDVDDTPQRAVTKPVGVGAASAVGAPAAQAPAAQGVGSATAGRDSQQSSAPPADRPSPASAQTVGRPAATQTADARMREAAARDATAPSKGEPHPAAPAPTTTIGGAEPSPQPVPHGSDTVTGGLQRPIERTPRRFDPLTDPRFAIHASAAGVAVHGAEGSGSTSGSTHDQERTHDGQPRPGDLGDPTGHSGSLTLGDTEGPQAPQSDLRLEATSPVSYQLTQTRRHGGTLSHERAGEVRDVVVQLSATDLQYLVNTAAGMGIVARRVG
jgi:hypothetical protein